MIVNKNFYITGLDKTLFQYSWACVWCWVVLHLTLLHRGRCTSDWRSRHFYTHHIYGIAPYSTAVIFQHATVRIKVLQHSWHTLLSSLASLCINARENERAEYAVIQWTLHLSNLFIRTRSDYRATNHSRLFLTLPTPTALKGPFATNCSFFLMTLFGQVSWSGISCSS